MPGIPKVDTDQLTDDIIAKMSSQGVSIQRGDQLETRFDLRRPCGILSLDIATGGGLPAGGLSQVDGPEGIGKNFLVNRYLAMSQVLYGDEFRGFTICLEYPFDKDYARKCGFVVPMSDYEIKMEQRKRAAENKPLLTDKEIEKHMTAPGKFYIVRASEAEAALQTAVEYIDSNAFQVGAIDSWDSMLTSPEADAALDEDSRIARPATVQTQWMKKVQSALQPRKRCPSCYSYPLEFKKHGKGTTLYCTQAKCGWKSSKTKLPFSEEKETTIIGIRQVRANLKAGMYGRAWHVGGAHALKHGKLIDIQLRPGNSIKSGETKIGKEIYWELIKGKAGTHEGHTGMYKYYFNPPEADIPFDIINTCISLEVITSRPPIKVMVGKEEHSFSSREDLVNEVDINPQIKSALYKAALVKSGLGHVRHK